MADRWRCRIILLFLLLFAAMVFLSGIEWGLPSRAADGFLFGKNDVWSGEQILALAPDWADPTLGADVDVDPLEQRTKPIVLNETDEQRAEIIRRYRLYSYQPDEMITFRALATMNPGALELDPRLYQYGGLWIYPVGALLKGASMLGIVPLRGDVEFYLNHPSAFGRFYVVARFYTVLWGLVGVWAVFWIARRTTGSTIAAAGAALLFICMPVVIDMSHEAKPHLPGAVLMLLTVIAATRFVETGRTRWGVLVGVLCGAAIGMVLTAAIIVVTLPVMVLLRNESWKRRIGMVVGGGVIAVLVYLLTNPYVPINIVTNRQVLESNLANTAAMYELSRFGEGVSNAALLTREAASTGLLLAGVVALIALALRLICNPKAQLAPLILLLIPSIFIFIQLSALGAGKPGEYGRFALFPAIVLAVAAACAVGIFSRRAIERVVILGILVVLTAFGGWFYLRGFIRDSSIRTSRLEDAYWLRMLQHAGGRTLGVYAEPAPYSLPPVDLFHWRIILLPRNFDITRDATDADVIVRPVDAPGPNDVAAGPFIRRSRLGAADAFPTRISWADKPIELWVRPELIERVETVLQSRDGSR